MAIVIIHGWSDTAESFEPLAEIVKRGLGAPPVQIKLGDWLSLQDDVTLPDIAEAMQRAWAASGLSFAPRAHDLIVHSTGALVVREWMTRYFTPASAPIKRFVMLAPANFGSGLAHKGRSFIGRAVKGWGSGFQTGTQVLRSLEIASPYTAALADRDLFDANARWYGPGAILATVLVGDRGYSGIRSIANEDGSDGTVRWSTANLNALRIDVALGSQPGSTQRGPHLQASRGEIAFGMLAGHHHGSIVDAGNKPHFAVRDQALLEALRVNDADFVPDAASQFPWQRRIDALAPAASSERLQNTVVHLTDHLGHEVDDYFFEFYRKPTGSDARFEQRFFKSVINDVHAYEANKSWRSLYLSIDELDRLRPQIPQLYVSVAASPEFKEGKQPVGYRGTTNDSTGELIIPNIDLAKYFAPHRTVILRLVIPRYQSAKVFELR
jgi:hypothetical protein